MTATLARILVLLMVVLAFANAQCLTLCSVQPCHPEPTGHCPQHSGKTIPDACLHGQFVKSAAVQVAPTPALIEIGFVSFDRLPVPQLLSVEGGIQASPPDPLRLHSLRI